MTEMYAEYGAIGTIVILFSGMLYWFRGFVDTLINNKMEDLETEIKQVRETVQDEVQQNRKIVVKLIDRINSHEKVLDNSFDRITDSGERRTEKLMFKIEENVQNTGSYSWLVEDEQVEETGIRRIFNFG